ncbi:PHP domain-containing protein [Marinobacterium arenosum]|uniref:PHP domain-containing protein n=1 Tax=Marinobacterium arenosum TaxID=2862496 RepID=UPI001C94EE7A|nr:PHP domain-containing protein [Marinobacterium arenosum]MBY4677567.1 PHP domain-containing protein [Marinobacterium arenosum]
MIPQRYDLHCHSTASDGTLAPADLLARAEQRELEVLALTDHDTVQGCIELQALDSPVQLVNGTELTCLWGRRVVHIVGLGVRLADAGLQEYLAGIDLLRQQRAERIAERLMKKGLPDLLSDARGQAAEGVVGRPHFAQAMVARGLVSSEQQAFKQYLGAGKTGDVKMDWPTLAQAVAVIRAAGGIAIVAHPTKYRFSFTKIRELVEDFKNCGGRGLEVSYTGISPSHHLELLKLVEQSGLLASAGSDFHSPGHHWTDIGRFMALRREVPHVLEYLL